MRILVGATTMDISPWELRRWSGRFGRSGRDRRRGAGTRNRSGASNSLTLDRPLVLKKAANGFYFVNGTPTGACICRHRDAQSLPDMIVSGINLGANMGDDTIYSGTVAAATEGFLLGIPSWRFRSPVSGRHFATAGRVARELVDRFVRNPIREPVLLNVNVPDRPYEDLRRAAK